MSYKFATVFFLLFGMWVSISTAKPRLKAWSYYTRYITPEIQPYHLQDSGSYTFSGNRYSDKESSKALFDSEESLSFSNDQIESGRRTECTYERDTLFTSSTKFQWDQGLWIPTEKTTANYATSNIPFLSQYFRWSGNDFIPTERWTQTQNKKQDTMQTDIFQNGAWIPRSRSIMNFTPDGKMTLQLMEEFEQSTGWTLISRYEQEVTSKGVVISTGYNMKTGQSTFRQYYDTTTGNLIKVNESTTAATPYDSVVTIFTPNRDSVYTLYYHGISASTNQLYAQSTGSYDAKNKRSVSYEFKVSLTGESVMPTKCTVYEYTDTPKFPSRTEYYTWVDNRYRLDRYSLSSFTAEGKSLGSKDYDVDSLSGKEKLRAEYVVRRTAFGQLQETYSLVRVQDSMVEAAHNYYYYEQETTPVPERKQESEGISVSPNPVTEVLKVIGMPQEIFLSAEVFSVDGRKVDCASEIFASWAQIHTSTLMTGVYILRLHTNSGVRSFSFVKD